MATITNWKAKVSVTIDITGVTGTQLNAYLVESGGSTSYNFKTTQTWKPLIESNPEAFDSISAENIGYMFRPTRYRYEIGVLPTKIGTVSDYEVLTLLQSERIEFKTTVAPVTAGFATHTFERCRVATGNPSQITISQVPVSQWTVNALKYTPPTVPGV